MLVTLLQPTIPTPPTLAQTPPIIVDSSKSDVSKGEKDSQDAPEADKGESKGESEPKAEPEADTQSEPKPQSQGGAFTTS